MESIGKLLSFYFNVKDGKLSDTWNIKHEAKGLAVHENAILCALERGTIIQFSIDVEF